MVDGGWASNEAGAPVRSRRRFITAATGTLAAAALTEPALRPAAAAAAPRLVAAPRHASEPVAGTAREAFRKLDDKIMAGMDRYAIPGAAVAVLYEGHEHVRGFGVTNVRYPVPVDRDTLFQIGSTSKTFTGTAAMRLVDSGRLDLDAQVRQYLPGFQPPAGAETVTVRQLLNHSAGWLGEDYYNYRPGGGRPAQVCRRHE